MANGAPQHPKALTIQLPSGKVMRTPMRGGLVDWEATVQRIWNHAVTYMVMHARRSGYLNMAAVERDLKSRRISPNPFLDWVRFMKENQVKPKGDK